MIGEELAQDESETGRSEHQRTTDKPWLWQKGRSANPGGRSKRDGAWLARKALRVADESEGRIEGWLRWMKDHYPQAYLQFLQRLLPRTGELTVRDERTFWHFLDQLRAAQDERRRGQLAGEVRQLDATVLEPVPAGLAAPSVRSAVRQDERSRPDPSQDTPGEDHAGKVPSTRTESDNTYSVTFDKTDQNERKT